MYNNPYKTYQSTQVLTASRGKVLLMLYEGAIRFCKLAQVKCEEKKIADKGKYVSKTMAILSELCNTLDHNIGGQIAMDLESLYMFMMDQMIEGNINNDVSKFQSVEKLLRILYEAWEDVINNPRPDGQPSAKLQPDLQSLWQKAQPQIPTQSAPSAP